MADFSLQDVLAEIDRQAPSFGVDAMRAKAIAIAENTGSGSMKGKTSYSGDAVSPMGASGVMQVMPDTARGLQKAGFLPADWTADPNNLQSQVQAGLAAMKEKSARMNNPADLGELASVYNGSSATHANYKAGRLDQLPSETKQYIEKLRRATMELGGSVDTPAGQPAGTPATGGAGTKTSTSSSTSRNVFDPGMLDMFTNSILDAVKPGGTLDAVQSSIAEGVVQRETAGVDLIASITQAAEAAGAAVTAKTAIEAGQAARRAGILDSMNLNPDATNNEMTRVLGVINSTDMDLAARKSEIDKRMAVGFFDNPLEWFVNQTRLPGMVAEYNGIVGTQNNATDRFKNLASVASTEQTLSQTMDADAIAKAGAAEATAIAKQAGAKAAQVNYELQGSNTRDALTVASLTGQKIDLTQKLLMTGRVSESESQAESERATAQKAAQMQLDGVNKILTAAGGNPIPDVATFKSLPAAKRETLLSAAGSGAFGKDFSEAFQLVYNDGSRQKLAQTGGATVVNWMSGVAQVAGNKVQQEAMMAEKLGKKFDSRKALSDELNTLQTQYETEAAVDMRKASKENPLRIDYTAVNKLPALAKNPMAIYLNKYGPGGTEPILTKVDEAEIINKFALSVSRGTMSAPAAAQAISDYYKTATSRQALATNWPMFGIAPPEKKYVIKYNLQGQANPVDLGNPTEVENLLVRKVSSDAAYKQAMEFATGGAALGLQPGQ